MINATEKVTVNWHRRVPLQAHSITALWPEPIYIAWWQEMHV